MTINVLKYLVSQNLRALYANGRNHVGSFAFSQGPSENRYGCFSNRPFRVKRFQTIHRYSVDVASLIGHLGSSAFRLSTATVSMSLTGSCFSSESAPGALPSWDSRTRWNNLSGDLAVNVTAGSSGRTNSPHPSSREGHHSTARWSSSVLLLD